MPLGSDPKLKRAAIAAVAALAIFEVMMWLVGVPDPYGRYGHAAALLSALLIGLIVLTS